MYAQNSGGGRALFVDGAATQGLPFSGLVKAMLHIGTNGAIGACYNGITGSSTIPCGFSVSHPSVSHYTINLGFSMAGRYPLFQPNFPDVAQVVITGFPANGISVTTVSGNPWSLTDLDFFLYIF
jgi:hypothetical protein